MHKLAGIPKSFKRQLKGLYRGGRMDFLQNNFGIHPLEAHQLTDQVEQWARGRASHKMPAQKIPPRTQHILDEGTPIHGGMLYRSIGERPVTVPALWKEPLETTVPPIQDRLQEYKDNPLLYKLFRKQGHVAALRALGL